VAAGLLPADRARAVRLTCGPADSLGRCRALLCVGHPVTCPAPGGLAELPGQLALGKRLARLDAGAVGGHRGGVDIRADGNHWPGEPEAWSVIWTAWSAAFQSGPLAWSAPAIPGAASGPFRPPA